MWIKEVEMVESVDDLKTSQSIGGHRCEDCVCPEKDHTELLQKAEQSRGAKRPKMEDRLLRGKQFAFMIYEYFQVTGAHEAVLDYSDPFSFTLHGNGIQDFETKGRLSCSRSVRFPMMALWKVCVRCEYGILITQNSIRNARTIH